MGTHPLYLFVLRPLLRNYPLRRDLSATAALACEPSENQPRLHPRRPGIRNFLVALSPHARPLARSLCSRQPISGRIFSSAHLQVTLRKGYAH